MKSNSLVFRILLKLFTFIFSPEFSFSKKKTYKALLWNASLFRALVANLINHAKY
jgi:hypothetical protein